MYMCVFIVELFCYIAKPNDIIERKMVNNIMILRRKYTQNTNREIITERTYVCISSCIVVCSVRHYDAMYDTITLRHYETMSFIINLLFV